MRFLYLICLLFLLVPKSDGQESKLKIDAGWISGTTSTNGDIRSFKGIPFAAPPVNALRWKAPQPVKPWPGLRKCDTFGASPMQGNPAPFSMWTKEFLIPDAPISEDCLYLNVWSGAKSGNEKRAVLVWIYGGGFVSGGSAVPIYDGEALARQGIIVVSVNYRVGIFGFFAHPELSKESGRNASGNYGLMDQIAALKWVQKNIAAFGGDPQKVTIAGQSAGSMSVNALVASPLTKGLFRAAIGESGAGFGKQSVPLKMAEEDGTKVAQVLNARSLSDLRKLSAAELMKANPAFRRPIVDGYVLPRSIAEIFLTQKEQKVKLLTGWNENEGLNGPIRNAAEFKAFAEKEYGKEASKLLELYPATNDSVAAVSQAALYRDERFGVQNYTWANAQGHNGNRVYVYRFSRKVPATGEYAKYGAFHTGEVPYVFNNLEKVNRPWLPLDRNLARNMSGYWVNFVKNGDPNDRGLPVWAPFTSSGKMIMNFGTEPVPEKLPDATQLEFLRDKISR